jgi:CHAT domain-containing protein/Tfp pilus assembly protein PilF/anti-sigma-K factor RskA
MKGQQTGREMEDELQDELLIRMYLLGELTEERLQQVEQRLLTEPRFYNRTMIAGEDLADQYVEGRISVNERKRFEESFLTTEEGRRQVQLSKVLNTYISTCAKQAVAQSGSERSQATGTEAGGERVEQMKRSRLPGWALIVATPSYVRLTALTMVVIAMAAAVWMFTRRSDLQKGEAALQAAYHKQRPLEARISEIEYAEWLGTRGEEPDHIDYVALRRAEILLFGEAVDHPSAASHHGLARLFLAEQEFGKAIDQLTQALKDDPGNARLHSDLGVALLEQGKAELQKDKPTKAIEELSNCLKHLDKAIELDGSLLEAFFNRALCYEYLRQPDAAEAAWKDYLNKDPHSRWTEEARDHLSKIEEQRRRLSLPPAQLFDEFIESYRAGDAARGSEALMESDSGGRNLIVERLLDEYLDLYARGLKREAAEMLAALTFAGNSRTGSTSADTSFDRFVADLADFYRAATPARLALLARARNLVKSANESFEQSSPEALESYEKAARLFEDLGDRCEFVSVRYKLATCYLRTLGFQTALDVLGPLAQTCKKRKYVGLQARVLYSMAYAAHALNRYSEALRYSNVALQLAGSINNRTWVVRTCAQLALIYQQLGDAQTSFFYVLWGLREADSMPSSEHRSQIYDAAADACTLACLYESALGYQTESMRIHLEMGNTLAISRGYAHLGMMHGKLGHFDEALRNLQLSIDVGQRVPDEAVKHDIEAFGFLRLGYLYKQSGDVHKAIEYYNRNLDIYPAMAPESYVAHKGRMSCYMALGDNRSADGELQTVLKLVERYRSNIAEESSRNTFFDIEQDTYDIAVDFAYSKLNDQKRAFEYSEASRARSLLDSTSNNARILEGNGRPELELLANEHPLELAGIQARLPSQVQVLQYSVLADKVLLWVISKDSLDCRESTITFTALAKAISEYVERVHHPHDDSTQTDAIAKELYGVLITPAESLLNPEKWICIIPDKVLNYLPFHALISPASGEYFISGYRLLVCPSSTIFTQSCEAAAAKEKSGPEQLLAVGNPSFDRDLYRLSDLFPSEREVEDIARLYGSRRVFTGARARKVEIRKYLSHADVIHLATHYVVDERSPLLSRMLLAKEAAEGIEGELQAREIYSIRPLRARLVVLAACQTLVERFYKGEGAVGAARPFISAGVPLIVASLWPVDSSATESLMFNFHRHRKLEKLSTAAALRQAQLDMIDSSTARFRQPYYWAAFVPIGGYAAF